MIKMVILYTLACGDVEATIADHSGNSIVVVDSDSKGAALIAWLREQADEVKTSEAPRSDILGIETLYF